MKVKCFDEQHEEDLTHAINSFIADKRILDIQFSTCAFLDDHEQIYCFSALVLYEE